MNFNNLILILSIIFIPLFCALNHSLVSETEATIDDTGSESENNEMSSASNSDDVFSASSDISQMLNSQQSISSIVHQFVHLEMQRLNSLSQCVLFILFNHNLYYLNFLKHRIYSCSFLCASGWPTSLRSKAATERSIWTILSGSSE